MHYVPDRPDEEEQPMMFCDMCNGDLYAGDSVYKIEGDKICEDCILEYFEWAKVELGREGL